MCFFFDLFFSIDANLKEQECSLKGLCFDFLDADALGNMDVEEQRRAKPFEFCFYSTTLEEEAVGFV